MLSRQLAYEDRGHGNLDKARRFEEQAGLAEQYSSVVQEYLLRSTAEAGTLKEMQGGAVP